MLKSFIETSRAYLLSAPALPSASAQRIQTVTKQLLGYVASDDAAGIERLFKQEHDVSAVAAELQSSPYSYLHYAAAQGKTQALTALLENLPLDVWNSRTQKKRRTPLMLAAQYGHAQTIYAFYDGFNHQMRKRTNLCVSTEPPALHDPHTDYDLFRPAQHANQLWRTIVNAKDVDGNTPLLLAVQNNHTRCCDALLLGKLTNLNTKNSVGDSALSVARRSLNAEIYRALRHYSGPNNSGREHR